MWSEWAACSVSLEISCGIFVILRCLGCTPSTTVVSTWRQAASRGSIWRSLLPVIHNPFSHISGGSFAIFGLNIAIWPWYPYQISLTMPAMCSTSLQTPKKRYHTCFYDAYFKSNDTSHICVAAILNYPIWPPEGKFSLSAGGFRKALIIIITGRNLIKLYKSERSMWYDRLSTPTNVREGWEQDADEAWLDGAGSSSVNDTETRHILNAVTIFCGAVGIAVMSHSF